FLVNMSNTTDAPILVEAWLNGVYAEPSSVKIEAAPSTWLGGLALNLPPHNNTVVAAGGTSGRMTSCVAPSNMNLLALVGRTGSHTTRMSAYVEPVSGGRTKIYESYDWSS